MFHNSDHIYLFAIIILLVNSETIIPPENCQSVTFHNLCLRCFPGYQLDYENNLCVKSPLITEPAADDAQAQTSGIEVQVVDINCKVREPSNPSKPRCKQCYYAFYLDQATGHCLPVSSSCKEWNDLGQCLTCYKGYQLISGQCKQSQQKNTDPNCFIYSQGICAKCAFRFYLNNERRCAIVSPYCKTWDDISGGCKSCFDGYQLKDVFCVDQSTETNIAQIATQNTVTQNCAQYNKNGQCIKCSYRHYFNTRKCIPVSDLCKTWDQVQGNCLTCYYGYQIFGGNCLQQIPNCNIRSNQGCVQCSNGYFLNEDLLCQIVSPLCKSFDPMTGRCLKCHQQYTLQKGKCVIL